MHTGRNPFGFLRYALAWKKLPIFLELHPPSPTCFHICFFVVAIITSGFQGWGLEIYSLSFKKKFFFDVDHFQIIEFFTILLLLYVLVFWQWGMWDRSCLTRDGISTSCIGWWSPNRWTTKEVPIVSKELFCVFWWTSGIKKCEKAWKEMTSVVQKDQDLILSLILRKRLFSSVQFSHSVVSDSLWPHGLQHTRPPCPSPTPRVYSDSCL